MIQSPWRVAAERRRALERTLAPHVDVAWVDPFMVHLSRAAVDGSQTVAALAVVEAHCAETGESPYAAFGEPITYAQSLGLETVPGIIRARRLLVIYRSIPIIVRVVGTALVLLGVVALQQGDEVVFSNGLLVALGLFLLVVVALARSAAPLMRKAGPSLARSILVAGAAVALVLAPAVLLDDEVLRVDAAVTALVGGMLFVMGDVADAVSRRSAEPLAWGLALAAPVTAVLVAVLVLL